MSDSHWRSLRLGDVLETEHEPEQVVERLLEQACHQGTCRRPPRHQPRPQTGSTSHLTHFEVLDRVLAGLPRRATELARLSLVAELELVHLQRLPAPARQAEIDHNPSRYRSPALVDLLIEESRRRLAADPVEANALAECSYAVALRLSSANVGRHWAATSIACAQAQCGVTYKALGDLERADACLQHALALFDREGTGDPLVAAEILIALAELRATEGRLVQADGCLLMARALYERCQAEEQAGEIEQRRQELRRALEPSHSPALRSQPEARPIARSPEEPVGSGAVAALPA